MYTSQGRLALDVQSFELMRGGHYVYVDKTRYIYQMLMEGRYFFLSRPRRFGKSLLISTLRCLFQGKKDLFEGLWIAEHGDWDWQSSPVIVIDFSEIANEDPDHLYAALETALLSQAAEYGLTLKTPLLQAQFSGLIRDLFQKTGQPVAVLIDEYDKPIIEHLGKNFDTAKANRYAAKYRQSGKKIFLMGINFDPEQRNLAEWLVREDE